MVDISRPGKVADIDAVVVGPFAVHPSRVTGEQSRLFTITHVQTGYAVRAVLDWSEACRLLDALQQATDLDWDFDTPEAAKALTGRVQALFAAVDSQPKVSA